MKKKKHRKVSVKGESYSKPTNSEISFKQSAQHWNCCI